MLHCVLSSVEFKTITYISAHTLEHSVVRKIVRIVPRVTIKRMIKFNVLFDVDLRCAGTDSQVTV